MEEITEGVVHLALRRIGSGKSPLIDGLPYELYLPLSHIFVPILTVLFNNWFRSDLQSCDLAAENGQGC